MQTFQKLALTVKERVKSNFAYATFHFALIMLFISVFSTLFGAANSIVAVIFVQITLSTMARDLTASPFKNFFMQAAVLLFMSIGACISVNIPAAWAMLIHFIVIFVLLYAYTFEYIHQLYFPYVLSYLFFVCLAPITFDQLPLRIVCVISGCVCIIVYQWISGRKRIMKTTKSVLLSIIEEANTCILAILHHEESTIDMQKMRASLCQLSQLIYDRRKKLLCISDASFAIIDVARGLENLVIELYEKPLSQSAEHQQLLHQTTYYLACFKAYLLAERKQIPHLSAYDLTIDDKEAKEVYLNLQYIREHMLAMNNDDKKEKYEPSFTSFSYRLQTALHFSEVRFVYALRVASLLALALFVVQNWQLEHGRWLLFTLVSISLPYVEEMAPKAKQRIIATLLGGCISLLCFTLIEDATIRTLILMASGYATFYCRDYATTFTCSTIGALGGNMLATTFGFAAVSQVVLIRLGYILIGVIVALLVSQLIYPFRKEKALQQLLTKFQQTNELLVTLCQQATIDKQFYYHLILQAFMQEEAIRQHAKALEYSDDIEMILAKVRVNVRNAHRHRPLDTNLQLAN